VKSIDKLIKSLGEPDEAIDELWKKESEGRIDAYEKGKLSSCFCGGGDPIRPHYKRQFPSF